MYPEKFNLLLMLAGSNGCLQELKKNFHKNPIDDQVFIEKVKIISKILSPSTCVLKKRGAPLHSQSGSTALRTISAASFGRRGAEFFDMMKRVTR